MPTTQQPFTIWTNPGRIIGEIIQTRNGGHASLYSLTVLFQCIRSVVREASTVIIPWTENSTGFYDMERRGN